MSEGEARNKASLLFRCHQALEPRGSGQPIVSLFVPGRVEFLGKHTDYAGGRSLLCAIERGLCLTARPREDNLLTLNDVVRGLETSFPIDAAVEPRSGEWTAYAVTVARRVAANFPGSLRGVDIAFGSDLPAAAGLSSSSVLVTALFLALARLNALDDHPSYQRHIHSQEDLAEYLGCIENGNGFRGLPGDRGVGTSGGSQDHTAILLSEAGKLVEYRFVPVRHEASLPFPEGHVLVIGVSGVSAEKTGAARSRYNRAAASVQEILRIWQLASGRQHFSLVTAGSEQADSEDQIRNALGQSKGGFDAGTLLGRFEQVMMESTVLIPDAVQALRVGDLRRLGEIVEVSQLLAERLLENQVPETMALVRQARDLGAVAASSFGAGFGGSVWALIREDGAETFKEKWKEKYAAGFPERVSAAEFLVTGAGPPLTFL